MKRIRFGSVLPVVHQGNEGVCKQDQRSGEHRSPGSGIGSVFGIHGSSLLNAVCNRESDLFTAAVIEHCVKRMDAKRQGFKILRQKMNDQTSGFRSVFAVIQYCAVHNHFPEVAVGEAILYRTPVGDIESIVPLPLDQEACCPAAQ